MRKNRCLPVRCTPYILPPYAAGSIHEFQAAARSKPYMLPAWRSTWKNKRSRGEEISFMLLWEGRGEQALPLCAARPPPEVSDSGPDLWANRPIAAGRFVPASDGE